MPGSSVPGGGQAPAKKISLAFPPRKLTQAAMREAIRSSLVRAAEKDILRFLEEHGRCIEAMPNELADAPKVGLPDTSQTKSRMIMEIPPLSRRAASKSRSFSRIPSLLGVEENQLLDRRQWVVYENDGSSPNIGSGSDQGRTAFLAWYMTFQTKKVGFTKVGWTVIDMRTPRPIPIHGADYGPQSTYETTGPNTYSATSSIDFEVTVHRTGTVHVSFPVSVGIDSAAWGKFVQDTIHKKVSGSPLFPWPKSGVKPYVQAGVAVLLTPQTLVGRAEFGGATYTGSIEIEGRFETGTHRTEATAGAKYVIRSSSVETSLGKMHLEWTPLGAIGRAFMRDNDGRESNFSGIEGGVSTSLMVYIGKIGIGFKGEILVSSDPSHQTGNPAGSHPSMNPMSPAGRALGSQEELGGPRGHHGTGQLILTFAF